MPVTLKDIAQRSGVSLITESYALNGKGRISKATRKQVQAVAEEMGYRVNASARAMRDGRFGAVSLILAPSAELGTLPAGLLSGIDQRLDENGVHLTTCHADIFADAAAGQRHKVIDQSLVDGHMVDLANKPFDRDADVTHGLPAIWLRCRRDHDCIYTDERGAGRDATRHLLERGHTRIAAAHGPTMEPAGHDRLAGYEDAMREAGLTPRFLVFDDPGRHEQTTEEPGSGMAQSVIQGIGTRMPQAQAWFATEDRPTAVLGIWQTDAMLVQAGVMRAGLSLPDDVALVAIADYFLNYGFPITTCCVHMTKFGRVPRR